MRYRLRTLLIVLVLGPPVLAVAWWSLGWRQRQAEEAERLAQVRLLFQFIE